MRPEDIKNRTFANALRGYDKDEVRSFLFRVAESSRELHDKLTATEAQLVAADDAEKANDDFGDNLISAEPAEISSSFADAVEVENGPADLSPFETESFVADPVDAASDAPLVDSMPAVEAFVEAPTASLASAEQSIADRYGAIGDRIAALLRNADESAAQILAAAENDSAAVRAAAQSEAAQVRGDAEERASQLLAEAQSIRAEADAYRDGVMAELANARFEQETALQEARTAAEAEVETFRVDSIAEITSLRSDAFVEIEELRSGANNEVAELRSVAQTDAEAMREAVLAEATASIEADEAEAARLKEVAEADRIAARSELDDVRSEVSTLLEQARTQSEFIKQEADEIIRTKVRANFEQAQARIDVLRNTEVASRERIVLAQTELASALTRLDSEPVPELDPSDSPAVIEEAVARHDEIAAGPETFEVEAGAVDAASGVVVDAPVTDSSVIDSSVIDSSVIEADVVEADVVDVGLVDAEPFEVDAEFETDEAETDDVEFGETDAYTTSEGLGDGSLSTYFAPGVDDEPQTTGDILAGAFGSPVDEGLPVESASQADSAWPTTDIADVESVEYETVNAADSNEDMAQGESPQFVTPEYEVSEIDETVEDAPATLGGFDVTEHVVVESADYGNLPVRGEGSDLPVRGQTTSEVVDSYTAPESFGAASLSDALPADDAPELGGASQEDALARLVREAMQEAVDSARKND